MTRVYDDNTFLVVITAKTVSYVDGVKTESPLTGASFQFTMYDSSDDSAITGLTNIAFSESGTGTGIYVAEGDGQYVPTIDGTDEHYIVITETGSYSDDIKLTGNRTIRLREF